MNKAIESNKFLGKRVICSHYGEGLCGETSDQLSLHKIYPLRVKFDNGESCVYDLDGKAVHYPPVIPDYTTGFTEKTILQLKLA